MEKLKDKIKSIKDSIASFVKEGDFVTNIQSVLLEDKRKLIIVCGCLLLILLIALLILVGKVGRGKKTPSIIETLTLQETPLMPSSSIESEDYIISRKKEDQWSESDVREWWTEPGDKEVRKIEQINDRVVQDLIEAAP